MAAAAAVVATAAAAVAAVAMAAAAAAAAAPAGRRSLSRTVLHTEASVGFGGQEIRILVEARWLLDHGWNVVVAAQPGSRLLEEARRAAVPVEPVRMRSALDVRAVLVLRRLIAARGVDLVHTHSSIDAWVGGVAARSRRLPVVRSRHVSIPVLKRRALVYRLADRVVTSGEAVAEIVARAGVPRERIVPMHPGIDTTRFHPGVSGGAVRAELGLTGSTVGLVANIRGSKGHDVFLEAARDVLTTHPSTRFVIVGDGIGFDTVRDRVKAMGLDGRVIMTGFRRDVPEVIAALDLLVLPSTRSEATSQVIPQALAVGTPVVVSDIGGARAVVEDGVTGRIVPPADRAALAEAIRRSLDDPDGARAMARRGGELVRARYGLDAVMRRTTAVYEALLAERHRDCTPESRP